MIPAPALMLEMASRLEASAHEQGWDSLPPMLGGVSDIGGAVMSFLLPRQPFEFASSLIEGVNDITGMLRDLRASGHGSQNPAGLCAVWVVLESWFHSKPPVPPLRIADTPGAQEMRQALVLDFGGRLHVAQRVRGGEPNAGTFLPDEDWFGTEPGLMVALRDFVLEHAMWLDEDAVDVVAVSRWEDSVDARGEHEKSGGR